MVAKALCPFWVNDPLVVRLAAALALRGSLWLNGTSTALEGESGFFGNFCSGSFIYLSH